MTSGHLLLPCFLWPPGNTEANFSSDYAGFVQAPELQSFVKKATGGRKSGWLQSLLLTEGAQAALRTDCSEVWTQRS